MSSRFPAYRGSDKNSNWFLPVPYFAYHGDFFKADRHGIRGSFFDTDRVDLTVSVLLSPPSGSDDVPARAGMPDLKATFEIGPQVDITLWRRENRARFVKLRCRCAPRSRSRGRRRMSAGCSLPT